jgi:acetate kinase
MAALNVLALNAGSSSLKFGLYRVGASRTQALLRGEDDSIGGEAGTREAVARVAARLAGLGLPPPEAIGHRIVHGGPKLRRHCLIDDPVVRQLEGAAAFAPLHTPAALEIIRYARKHFPGLAQAACFDTAFHAGLPDVARVLPIPKQLQAEGIQRYGFHGLSCESILRQLVGELPKRVVIAHLGNGASVTAVRSGKSIDTSMGLTPSGGVVMGTRSGDLDPGVLVYLMREKKFDAAALEELVDRRSGLLGVSGLASDMRRLREAGGSSADARLAIEMFCYSVRKQVAAMVAALDGLDLLVFTGGIGENDAEARAAICSGLSWIGVSLDPARNRSGSGAIQDGASRCAVRVLASREDEQIARHVRRLIPRS